MTDHFGDANEMVGCPAGTPWCTAHEATADMDELDAAVAEAAARAGQPQDVNRWFAAWRLGYTDGQRAAAEVTGGHKPVDQR